MKIFLLIGLLMVQCSAAFASGMLDTPKTFVGTATDDRGSMSAKLTIIGLPTSSLGTSGQFSATLAFNDSNQIFFDRVLIDSLNNELVGSQFFLLQNGAQAFMTVKCEGISLEPKPYDFSCVYTSDLYHNKIVMHFQGQ